MSDINKKEETQLTEVKQKNYSDYDPDERLLKNLKRIMPKDSIPLVSHIVIALLTITAILYSTVFLPRIVSEFKKAQKIQEAEEAMTTGVIGDIDLSNEDTEANDVMEFQKGNHAGNLIQGNGNGCRLATDATGNIYIGGNGRIDVYNNSFDKIKSIKVVDNAVISYMNCVGDKLFFTATGINSIGLATSVAMSYNLGSSGMNTLDIASDGIGSQITSFFATNKDIYCTFLSGDAIKKYSIRGNAKNDVLKVKNSIFNHPYILDVDEDVIFYYEDGSVYKHSIKSKDTERIPSYPLSMDNLPIIYKGKAVYIQGSSLYCNKKQLISESCDIENLNIYNGKILYNVGEDIFSYDLKKMKSEKIYSSESAITDFYVSDSLLITSIAGRETIDLSAVI